MQACARRPPLANQERSCRLGERRWIGAHDGKMPPLCATGEVSFFSSRRDRFETVEPAVDILERQKEAAACIDTQRERGNMLGCKIGMVSGCGTSRRPDPSRPSCCAFSTRRHSIGSTLRGCRAFVCFLVGRGLTRNECWSHLGLWLSPTCSLAFDNADPICDPVGCIGPGYAEVATDQIAEPTARTGLVVEPEARLRTCDDDREAAFSAPAPFMPGPEGGLAQKLDRQLRHARAKLGMESLPIPPAHRHPRDGCTSAIRDRKAPVAMLCKGWRRRADTGRMNRVGSVSAPGSAARRPVVSTSERVHPVVLRLAQKG